MPTQEILRLFERLSRKHERKLRKERRGIVPKVKEIEGKPNQETKLDIGRLG